MDETVKKSASCEAWQGTQPACAPLANPYVPYQTENPETYKASAALIRGTIFPGLDLPLKGQSNSVEKRASALHDLQTLDFAITELGLYLDTHYTDTEAIALYNEYVEQYQQARQNYEQSGMPLVQSEAGQTGEYLWLADPWPWDAETEG